MKITFRLIEPVDYQLVAKWLAEPHVSKWWHDGPPTVELVEKKYAKDPQTSFYIAYLGSRSIGAIQSYWVDDYPEHAESVSLPKGVGVDLFIGEPDLIGRGYGTQMLKDFLADIVWTNYPEASGVVADPCVANIASVRAFEKAGFEKGKITDGEDGPEQVMIFKF